MHSPDELFQLLSVCVVAHKNITIAFDKGHHVFVLTKSAIQWFMWFIWSLL